MKLKSTWFVVGFLVFLMAASISTYYAGIGFFNHYTKTDKSTPVIQCPHRAITHEVNILHGEVEPQQTSATLCDTLKIVNRDDTLRLIAFGPHEHHTPYDGITEKVLDQNDTLTITLNQLGNFTFHDHLHDSVIGIFTVKK